MKLNDWIVANINNPEFTAEDFKDIGMDLGNTQILPMESYLNSSFITNNDAFKNDSGEFLKEKFADFYRNKLSSFGTFLASENSGFEYDLFDTDRDITSKVKDPNFRLEIVSNPDRVTTGISARNKVGEKKLTVSELALTQNIYDPETGEFLDYSPNDKSLVKDPVGYIKSLFDEPLVLATWEEDGEHIDPITNRTVKHTKGEYKLNDLGTYYTERLNGRSLIGKLTISAFDTLTVDGEGINKYDFFDSDSLDKSVTGTIAKSAAAVAPLFFGPVAAGVYSGALIARELAKSLPMLYGMVGSLFGITEDSAVLNSISAIGLKFTGGVSEYSQLNTFTFENVANLMADVATQWGQQKLIAKSVLALRGGNKAVEAAYAKALLDYVSKAADISSKVKTGQLPLSSLNYLGDPSKWMDSPLGKASILKFVPTAEAIAKKLARLGADASLAYMAIISNTDVYQSMLEHGTTKKEASAVALGSTLGMFLVDKYLGLGEMFFDDLTADHLRAIRNVFKKEAASWGNSITEIVKNPEITYKNKVASLINKGIQLGKSATKEYADDIKYHSTGFLGKAIGEGLEETSEELVADLSKLLYELAGDLGYDTSTKDVGAWENALPRYGMSLFGGALGGGLFYGVDIVQNGRFKRDNQLDELIYLVRNKKTKDLLSDLKNWRDKGKLGSTNLSASKYDTDELGNRVYLTAESAEDSLNEFIYKRMRESILLLDNIINENNVGLSEDELYKLMVLSESRFLALKDVLLNQSYSTGYQLLFLNITRDLINALDDLIAADLTWEGVPGGTLISDQKDRHLTLKEEERRTKNLAELTLKRDNLEIEKNSFLSGEKSFPYTRKMLFAMDSGLNKHFISMTYPQWLKANHGKEVDSLTLEEAKTFKQEYLTYKKGTLNYNLTTQFQTFLNVEELVTPHLLNIQENLENFKKFASNINKLFDKENSPFNTLLLDYDSQLEGESDEIYAIRNKKAEGESDESFNTRVAFRMLEINRINTETNNAVIQQINLAIEESGGFIDPVTLRYIHSKVSGRKLDILNNTIQNVLATYSPVLEAEGFTNVPELNLDVIEQIKKLNPDLSNLLEVSDNIRKIVYTPVKEAVTNKNSVVSYFRLGLINVFNNYGFDYDSNNITGKTLQDFITERNKELLLGEAELFLINEDDDSPIFDITPFVDDVPDMSMENLVSMVDIFRYSLDREAISYNPLSEEEINSEVELRGLVLLSEYQQLLSSVVDSIKNNLTLQLLVSIDDKVRSINPVTELVKSIGLSLNKDAKNIENVLNVVFENMLAAKSEADFLLTDEQIQDFEEAELIINMTQAYLYAASTTSNFNNPIGHNVTINEFAENHKDIVKDFQPLATIDSDIAGLYINELEKYNLEIEYWRNLSNNNQINKELKFINAESKFNKSRYEFFKINRDAFEFTLDGNSIDLLKGFEAIPDTGIDKDDNLLIINLVENLFYDNLHSLLNNGYTLLEVLKGSLLLESITNIDNIDSQVTSSLDENISYDKWTDYDKAIYLLTVASLRANDFNTFLKSRINEEANIAPLTIQEYISRVAIASISGHNIMKSGLEYIQGISSHLLPLLDSFVFVDGVAGAGKTLVIARNVSRFINSDDIWLSAPKKPQLDTLLSVIGRGTSKIREDLMKEVIDPAVYKTIMDDVSNQNTSDYFDNTGVGLDGTPILRLNTDKLTFKGDNIPKLIIIDEVTHFSNIELLILNEYARRNNVPILGLGDSNQNGFTKKGLNIDREVSFLVRTPKLSISLRDANLLKLANLSNVVSIMELLQLIEGELIDPAHKQKLKSILDLIQRLNFKVYNLDFLNGDLITTSMSLELAAKLFGTVGYVGDTSTDTYKQLKAAGLEPTVLTTEEVQGLEFDYIVIDKAWSFDFSKSGSFDTLKFLQDLYTMMSRGKSGSIFIDNGLSKLIGQNKEEFNTALAPSLKNAIEKFRTSKLNVLDKMDLSEPTSTPEESEKPKTEVPSSTPLNQEIPKEEQKPIVLEEDESLQIEEEEVPTKEILKEVKKAISTSRVGSDELEQSALSKYELLSSDLPIRVYGSAHLSGFRVEETTEVVDGEELKKNIWHNEYGNRDLGVFTKESTIESGADKDALIRDLLSLKSVILYAKDWSYLPASIAEIIPEENFKNIEYKIEVRDKSDADNFVGYTGLKDKDRKTNTVRTINGLVYSFVASFKNKDGEDCIITLGLLADPETWSKRIPDLQRNIDREIENTEDLAERDRLERYKTKELPLKVLEYTLLLLTMANKYNSQKLKDNLYFSVNPNFSGLTYLRKTNNDGSPVKVKPLLADEGSSFLSSNPYLVTSDVFIYTGNIPGVKDSVRGKAVMFMSGDTTLSPDELPNLYMTLKEETAQLSNKNPFNLKYKPSVRMVMLDNNGVSFLSLSNPRLKDMYTTKGTNTKKNADGEEEVYLNVFPFELDYMGSRMLVSAWNFRANLHRFVYEFTKFKLNNNLTDDLISNILIADDLIYKISLSAKLTGTPINQESISKILKDNNVTLDLISLVKSFNDGLANKVRQFRLGGSEKGRMIRRLTNIAENNIFYKGQPNPNGIYLTPKTALDYTNLIDATFEAVFDPILKLLDKNTGESWPIDRLISPNSKKKNSLSGLISSMLASGNSLKVSQEETGLEFNLSFPEHDVVKAVPVLLTLLNKFINRHLLSSEGEFDASRNRLLAKVNGEYKLLNYGRLLDILKPGYDSDQGIFDTRFSDMMSLMFHGTTGNFKEDTLKSTDAYFKEGFFIDPMFSDKKVELKGVMLFRGCATDKRLFSVDVAVDMPVFDITLSDLKKSVSTTQSNSSLKVEEVSVLLSPEEANNLLVLLDDMSLDSSIVEEYLLNSKTLDEFYQKLLKSVNLDLSDFLSGDFKTNQLKLDTIIEAVYQDRSLVFKTIRDFIQELTKTQIPENAEVACDNHELVVTLSESLGLIVKMNNFSKKLEIEQRGILSEEQVDIVSVVKNAVLDFSKNLDSDVLEELEENPSYKDLISRMSPESKVDMKFIKTALAKLSGNQDFSDEVLDAIDDLIANISNIETHCNL